MHRKGAGRASAEVARQHKTHARTEGEQRAKSKEQTIVKEGRMHTMKHVRMLNMWREGGTGLSLQCCPRSSTRCQTNMKLSNDIDRTCHVSSEVSHSNTK